MTRVDFVKHAILKARRSHILNALFIVLAIAVPTLLRFAIDPFVQGGLRYIAYVGTIMFAAVFLGWRAAVLTTLGSMIVANLLFIRIRSSTWSPGEITIGLILFGCSAALLIVLGQTLRRTVIELDATAQREAFLAAELAHKGKNHLALVERLRVSASNPASPLRPSSKS